MTASLLGRIDDRTARIVIVGQGYVGLPVAMRASEVGFAVIGYEIDQRRVAALREGRSFVEDVPDSRLAEALQRGYSVTDQIDDLAGFDVAIISVPTPLRDGAPDLTFVESAVRALAAVIRPGALVVLESTTYPGTTEELVRPLLEESGLTAGPDFLLGYSPERIDPGNAVDLREHPEGRVRHRRNLVPSSRSLLRHIGRQGRAGGNPRRSGVGQAAGEHLPAREHRARQRTRDVRGGPRRGHLVGHRRRLEQALRLHAIHARTRRRRPLPPRRSVLPVMAGPSPLRSRVPVRRARERRQRTHARLRRHPSHGAPESSRARSRALGSSCSAWRTRPAPRTGANPRRSWWQTGSRRWAPR